MGAKVSICNLTAIVLNVALKQLGPVYYENHLFPGNCTYRTVGKVFFTVEARVWKNGTNDYTDAMAILPGAALHQGIGALATGALAVKSAVDLESAQRLDQHHPRRQDRINDAKELLTLEGIFTGINAVSAVGLGAGGAVTNLMDRVDPKLITTMHSVLMEPGLKFNIMGGPTNDTVKIEKTNQVIPSNFLNGLRIVIVKP